MHGGPLCSAAGPALPGTRGAFDPAGLLTQSPGDLPGATAAGGSAASSGHQPLSPAAVAPG
eukprot:2438169-Lingulodinium_polyedra.AAC.1